MEMILFFSTPNAKHIKIVQTMKESSNCLIFLSFKLSFHKKMAKFVSVSHGNMI